MLLVTNISMDRHHIHIFNYGENLHDIDLIISSTSPSILKKTDQVNNLFSPQLLLGGDSSLVYFKQSMLEKPIFVSEASN